MVRILIPVEELKCNVYGEDVQCKKNTGQRIQNEEITKTEGNMRSLRYCVVHRKDESRKRDRQNQKKNIFGNHSEYPRILTHRNNNRKRQSFFSIYSLK